MSNDIHDDAPRCTDHHFSMAPQQLISGNGDAGSRGMFHSGASAAERGSLRAIKVLVADDDPDTVLSLRMLLQTEGYDVRGVYNSVAVFEAVRKFEPSAVLLDIGMPDMSGYDVARQLRVQRGDELLLIAVTARVKASDRLLAQLAGFDHHVSKPYKPEDILSLLAPLSARRL